MRNRIVHIIGALLLTFSTAQAQQSMDEIAAKYPFLDTASMHMQYFGDSAALENFYRLLDKVIFEGKGKVNVVHMGGSHVQGGTLSHTLRRNLGVLAPELQVERGFFFPHTLARTNMPSNIHVKRIGEWQGCRNSVPGNDCPWGVSGINAIAVSTSSAFALQSYRGAGEAYQFTELRVFEHFESATMDPVIYPVPDSTLVDSVAGVRRLFYNELQDSIYVSFEMSKDSVKRRMDPRYVLQGFQMVMDTSGLVYHALGVNGASTKSFLKSENLEEQAAYLHPDLVIFGLGINDAYKPDSEWHPEDYEARYDTLVAQFLAVNPNCNFIFMTNNDSYYKRRYPNKHALDVQEVMKRLSAKHNAVYWDLFEVMGGLGSVAIWEENGLAKSDKIHFTRRGYMLNSDLLFWAIWEGYEAHLKALAAQDQLNTPAQ